MALSIFISYGHNDHSKLIDRFFDAISEHGHKPWKDNRYEGISGIAPGKDFTDIIYEAIKNSDFVIAFVSRVTKASDYCKDERQYAYNNKGDHFIQIRLDYEEITLGNARSYIDMSEVEESDGSINEKLFEQKMISLFAAFRDPSSFAEGGFTPWTKLDRHLKVYGAIKYEDFINIPETDDFVGREWLFEKCHELAMDESIPCRLFVILGEAGTGKSSFVQHLAQDRDLVRSIHICVYNQPSTRSARDTLKNLAYVLALTDHAYLDYIKNRDLEKLRDMELDGIFEYLFLEPLKAAKEKYLLIIDGLDEMDERSGLRPLIALFSRYAHKLNPNISFLLTSRPDENIMAEFEKIGVSAPPKSIILNKETNKEDLKQYIFIKLHALNCYSDELAERLFEASDGNFEYLSLSFKEAEEEGLDLNTAGFPKGLVRRYTQYFDRRMDISNRVHRLNKMEHIILSLLSVSVEPVPIDLLAHIANMDEFDTVDTLALFGSLIRSTLTLDSKTVVSLFTKSMRDYLLSKRNQAYYADAAYGIKLISEYIMTNCTSEKALSKQPYLDSYGILHLLQYHKVDPEAVSRYFLCLFDENADHICCRLADAFVISPAETVSACYAIGKHLDCLGQIENELYGRREKDALSVLISFYDEIGECDIALMMQADILLWDPSPQARAQAETLYQQVCESCEEADRRCSDYETRRELAITYRKLASLSRSENTHAARKKAERLFKDALDLFIQNYKDNPCYESRRSLAITYELFGDMARCENTPESRKRAKRYFGKDLALSKVNNTENASYESRKNLAYAYYFLGMMAQSDNTQKSLQSAEKCYLKMLALLEQNYKENPCYESRRVLAITFERLGDIAKLSDMPNAPQHAKKWFKIGLGLVEQNYKDNPCYHSRRNLACTYERFGDLALSENTPESRQCAEKWYLEEFALLKLNHEEYPCYQSRSSLAVICVKLGDHAMSEKTPEGGNPTAEWYQKALVLYEQNHLDNPCYESRRDLALVFERLGDLAFTENTPEVGKAYEVWYNNALALCEQNHRNNPCSDSRKRLNVIYNKLSNLALSKNTPSTNARANERLSKTMEISKRDD